MALILNIETSGKYCSVALVKDGMLEWEAVDGKEMNHAVILGQYVEKALDEVARKEEKLDAVAVSMGPGSYTGLRIGLSMAKGLCFSLDVPLIGIRTLEVLAVKAMFRNEVWEGDEIIVPMVDARRMEVYTAAFDFSLNEVKPERAEILTGESCSELAGRRSVLFIGDGSEKFKEVYRGANGRWLGASEPRARDMNALAEKKFRDRDFLDLAYSTPDYIKEYQATISKNKVLRPS